MKILLFIFPFFFFSLFRCLSLFPPFLSVYGFVGAEDCVQLKFLVIKQLLLGGREKHYEV